ncbi:ABC transporter permease [Pseudactinotalea sp.]|uniref:ABC transporter permease n=1 Tax=Pseudactinotalea sp. TaxID=1926260 RepID=UPI003B3B6FC7
MSGILGALVEAWDELRVHKLRVLLSLVGVAVSVMAMTSVTAAGEMMQRVNEQLSAGQGRPATFQLYLYPQMATEEIPDLRPAAAAFDEFVDRYQVEGAARSTYATLPVVTNGFLTDVGTQAVDQTWAEVAGVEVAAGRWFARDDDQMLSPPIIVNDVLLQMLGHETWTGPFTVDIQGARPTTATVIGTYPDPWQSGMPESYMLYDSYVTWVGDPNEVEGMFPDIRIWIDPSLADELQHRLTTELSVIDGQSYYVDVWRMDAFGTEDYLATFRLVVTGVGLLILGLSALNLVNIAIVTLRQRIREIGVRRALGATSRRVFFAVMLESVVATALAGLIGVVISVVVLRNISLLELLYGEWRPPGLVEPGYPASAAVIGLVASVAVGALAGLVPAIMAVRIRPIEAIRY